MSTQTDVLDYIVLRGPRSTQNPLALKKMILAEITPNISKKQLNTIIRLFNLLPLSSCQIALDTVL